jgi:hypothetical protein
MLRSDKQSLPWHLNGVSNDRPDTSLMEPALLENIDDRSPYLLLSDEAFTFVRQGLCIVLISPHAAEIVL